MYTEHKQQCTASTQLHFYCIDDAYICVLDVTTIN
jgi:hypothetical protein